MIDPAYAKKQLDVMTREWYMKPDGALPAYEYVLHSFFGIRWTAPAKHSPSQVELLRRQPARPRLVSSLFYEPAFYFGELTPNLRATFRVFKIERKMHGREDLHFLERVFQKLLINFTWCARSPKSASRVSPSDYHYL